MTGKLFRYSVDKVNGRFVYGWCFHRLLKRKKLAIRISADGEVLGVADTVVLRRDLKRKKLHPTGVCGFFFNFRDDFEPSRYRYLHLSVENFRTPLVSIPCSTMEKLEPDPARNIFFMHIPKSAGSSFNSFLRRCYSRENRIFHLERLEDDKRFEQFGKRRCISGHLPWYVVRQLTENAGNYHFYAIIRDPLKHLHSHLNYVRGVIEDAEYEQGYGYAHNETIKQLSEKLALLNFRNDRQVRSFVDTMNGYELDFFDNIQTRYFLDYRPERVEEKDLENAKKNIERFHLVGLTEEYDLFLKRFCIDMSLPPCSQKERSNKSDSYKLFDDTLVADGSALGQLIDIDVKLYRHVLDRYWR